MATYAAVRRRSPRPVKPVTQREIHRHRTELLSRVMRWLDLPLSSLALVMLGLLVADYGMNLTAAWQNRVNEAENAIWAIFAIDFVFELALAPSKLDYLKNNWLTAISVLLPVFGAFRVLRAAQLLRGISLVRLLLTFNRGTRALGRVVRRGQLGYVLALTFVVALAGGAGAYYFERGQPGSSIGSIWDGLWWAATLVTTINSGLSVETAEGRIIGLLLRVFALGATGYLTAILAAYLVGQQKAPKRAAKRSEDEIAQLRAEIVEMRSMLQQLLEKEGVAPAGEASTQHGQLIRERTGGSV